MISLYIATLIPFVALDALMLTTVMAPMFRATLGAQVLESPRWMPAILFYLGYAALTTALAGWPALKAGAPMQALWTGALLGLMAYGTYELTNFSTLRDWTFRLAATDLAWGTVLTAVSAWAGVTILRALG